MILSSIVATSRADVQGGVSHAVMWTKPRKPFHGMEIQFLRTIPGLPLRAFLGTCRSICARRVNLVCCQTGVVLLPQARLEGRPSSGAA